MAITDFLRKKKIDVADVTDQPTISRTMCLKITSGDDSTTGTGEIILDWSNIASEADIGVYDENDNLLDYYFETFDETEEKAVIWVFRDWVQDGSTQLQIAYGDGPSDQSVSASTVFGKETDFPLGFLKNETSGDALDISGNNNDGTVHGATQGAEGQIDGAYDYDGSDDYTEVADDASFRIGTSDFTIAFWEYCTKTNTNDCVRFDKGGVSGSGSIYFYDGKDKYRLRINGNDVFEDHTIETYDWKLITITRDGDDIYFHIDNVEQGVYSGWGGVDINATSNLYIGSEGGGSRFYQGKLDHFIWLLTALSSDERIALYNATKSSPDFFSQQAGKVAEVRPIVSTDEISNIESDFATLNGSLDDLGEESEVDVWFDYSTDDSFSTYDSTPIQTLTETGSFSDDISDLTFAETFYVRAAATDGTDIWYDATKSFVAVDFSYIEDEGSNFETGTLEDVEVVDGKLQLEKVVDYIESFEDDFGDWVRKDSDQNWERNSGGTGSNDTGPSGAYDGDHYIYVETSSSGAGGNDVSIIEYDLGETLSGIIDFYFHQYGDDQGTLYLEGYDGSDWIEIWSSTGNQGDEWFHEEHEFSNYSKLRFKNVHDSGGSYNGDIALDLIIVKAYKSSGTRITDPIDLSSLESAEDSIVQWDSDEPTDTSIKVESSLSTDGGDTWNSWKEHSNGSAISSIEGTSLSSGLIKFRQTLETSDQIKIPTLSKFEFFVAEGEVSDEQSFLLTDQSESEDSVSVIHAIITDSGEGADSVYKEYVSFTLQESSTGNDQLTHQISLPVIEDSSSSEEIAEIESVFNLEDDSAGSDDIDSRFGVFDSSSSSEDITDVTVYAPVDDTGTVDEQLGIEIYFSIQSEYEIGDWVGYRVQLTDWMNKTEKIGVETSLITFTESLTGDDSNISINYLVQLSDEALSEEILSFLKLTTILESGLSQDGIVLNIFQNVQDSIQSAIESISGTFFAKVRQYAVGDDSEFPSNFSNFVDDITGSDNVLISQSLTIQDEGLGTDNDPKGCGTLYEDVSVAETISIESLIQVSDEVISSDDEDIKKLFTVNDDGVGNDEIDSAFCIQDVCTVEESPEISSSMLLTENADSSDDATQVYSGLEGDVLVKAINSEGKLRIAHIVKFFRSSLYTFKIKETAKGEDNVRKRI